VVGKKEGKDINVSFREKKAKTKKGFEKRKIRGLVRRAFVITPKQKTGKKGTGRKRYGNSRGGCGGDIKEPSYPMEGEPRERIGVNQARAPGEGVRG